MRRIPVIRHCEDVYAAEETKVHTFSRQAIAAMLQVAETDPAPTPSAAPPAAPPSGVRLKDGSPPPASRMTPVPPPPALPKVWKEEDEGDDEGLEPTLLHEKAEKANRAIVELKDEDLVIDVADAPAPPPPPAALLPPPPSPEPPAVAALKPPSGEVKITLAPVSVPPAPVVVAPRPRKAHGIDATTVAIFVVTFVGTIAAALRWVL